MPRDGAGNYNRYTPGTPYVNNTTIDETVVNAEMADIATALTGSMARDGQSPATANIPMGGYKHTNLAAGSSGTDSVQLQQARNMGLPCQGRITLTTVTAITTADVTAAPTVYFTPYKGNIIALFDGTNWNTRTFAELSIAVPATTSTMYDLFAYDNSGNVALEALAWTNDTTRATALVLQDGVYCKTGVLTRRYLGSFRTTTVSGQTEDSLAKRYVWNYYNRVKRPMRAVDTTDSWSYTTATFRQANNNAANQLDFIVGASEDEVSGRANSIGSSNAASGSCYLASGIGLDSTTTNSAQINDYNINQIANVPQNSPCIYEGFPGVGRHYLAWLEYSTATGATTWFGDAGDPKIQSGISGSLLG